MRVFGMSLLSACLVLAFPAYAVQSTKIVRMCNAFLSMPLQKIDFNPEANKKWIQMLAQSEVVKTSQLMNRKFPPYLIEFKDGQKAVAKEVRGPTPYEVPRSAQAEVAAYEVAVDLDIYAVPPTIFREITLPNEGTVLCSLQYWIPRSKTVFTLMDIWDKVIASFDGVFTDILTPYSSLQADVEVLDVLISNPDRTLGNILERYHGRFNLQQFAPDHDQAFEDRRGFQKRIEDLRPSQHLLALLKNKTEEQWTAKLNAIFSKGYQDGSKKIDLFLRQRKRILDYWLPR